MGDPYFEPTIVVHDNILKQFDCSITVFRSYILLTACVGFLLQLFGFWVCMLQKNATKF